MILLSICIPTYNRAQSLEQTIASIVSDEFFCKNDYVEIVISDNCSTDKTQEICAKYVALFPSKIKYICQTENIEDRNFIEVLKSADGKYAKLNNDTLMFNTGALEYICQKISSNEFKEAVFFTNGHSAYGEKVYSCNNMEEFLGQVSYQCTWIGGLCVQKEAFMRMNAPERFYPLKLVQVDIVCRMLDMYSGVTVVAKVLFHNMEVYKKANFSMEKIFGDNYLTILEQFVASGSLDRAAYNKAKKDILIRHILPTKFSRTNLNYEYIHESCFFRDMHQYWGNIYFYKNIALMAVKKMGVNLERRVPKWILKLVCCFVPRKKNRDRIRKKYSRT